MDEYKKMQMGGAPPASSVPSAELFHGLALPDGVEKRVLYHSTFRTIATYAMSLADLDRELLQIVRVRGGVIKEDARRNLCGKRARRTRSFFRGHPRMLTCVICVPQNNA